MFLNEKNILKKCIFIIILLLFFYLYFLNKINNVQENV